MKRTCIGLLVVLLAVSGCSTLVLIETDPPGAEVVLDGRYLGESPVERKLSNAVWEDYRVEIRMDGYRTTRARLDKEIKPGPAIGGFFFAWPMWLWAYGPEPYQYFRLIEE